MTKKNKEPIKKSSLSQVFLRDEGPCYKMIESLKASGVEEVCEIGPGGGALTKLLLEAKMKVTAIEKDKRFFEYLNKTKNHQEKNLTIINEDFLNFDLEKWLNEKKENNIAICGNIPYSISTAIITKTIFYLNKVSGIWLLVQHEFAKRMAASPSTKSYGSLSVYLQLRAHVKLELFVDRICFSPIPKVDSAIVSLKERKHNFNQTELKATEKITKYLFSKRRKKLKTSIKTIVDLDKHNDCPFDLNLRCENLDPDDFIKLSKWIKQSSSNT